jgi:MFS family permease
MPSGLSRNETKSALVAFNWSSGLRAVFDTMSGASGFVFVGFALSLGVAKEQIGFLTTLMSLACILQMVGLFLVTRVRDKKEFIILLGVLEPAVMIAAVLAAPHLPLQMRFAFIALAAFMAAAAIHLIKPATDEWLASAIPESIRGRYLGRRMQVINLTGIVATLACGYLAERIDKTDAFRLSILIAVGALFGFLAVLALRRAPLPDISAEARVHWTDLPEIRHNRQFLRCMLSVILFNIPFWICSPYYQVVNLKILEMRQSTIAYLMVIYAGLRVVLMPWIGRWADRIGPRRMLMLLSPLYLFLFLGYAVSTPGRVWPVFAGWALCAPAEACYGVAITAALYQSIPDTPARQAFFAVYNLAVFSMSALGSMGAVLVLNLLKDQALTVGPFHLGQFQFLYLIAVALIVPAIFTLRLLPGPAADDISDGSGRQ